jgi:hypothetical protein
VPPAATPGLAVTTTLAPTPAATITPLPLPALDYPSILGGLSRRFIVLGDLRAGGAGMIDQWEKARDGQPTSTACSLQPDWPEAFTLTPEQLALLHAPGVADPLLEEALQLQQEGIALALQARALYVRDCSSSSLVFSVADGLPLAQQAYDKLTQAQAIADEMRAR